MSDYINENASPLIVQGNEYDFWLCEEDDIYDKKYGDEE